MKKLPMLILFLLISSVSILAKKPVLPQAQATSFFELLAKDRFEEACALIFEDTELLKAKPNQAALFARQLNAQLPLYGKSLGYEFVGEKLFGESVIRIVYILKTTKIPTTWVFHFYKVEDRWDLVNIEFKDDMSLLH